MPLAVAAACAAAVIVSSLMPAAARERNSVLAVAPVHIFQGSTPNASCKNSYP